MTIKKEGVIMDDNEKLFWRRVANLEYAIENAEHEEFKWLWRHKLYGLMKMLPVKRVIN